jgi:hypothetical protein
VEEDSGDVQCECGYGVAGFEIACEFDDKLCILAGEVLLEGQGETELSVGVVGEFGLRDVGVHFV